MAFILDDILRLPDRLLCRIVKVNKGSRQMMLRGSGTTDEPRARTRRDGEPAGRHRTDEDLEWPTTVSILDNIVLAPLTFIRWAVNKVRRQVDSRITNECGSTDQSASRTRRGED